MRNRTEVTAGMVFRGPYPFVREKVGLCDEDGPYETMTWKPGTYAEMVGPEDAEQFADGAGEIILTVVSIHKPGRFPTRVFFTRKWRDPDGKEWGKGACRCVTTEKFLRLARGYRFPYRVNERKQDWKMSTYKKRDRQFATEPVSEDEIAF